MKMNKIFLVLFLSLISQPVMSNETSFNDWLKEFKKYALKNDIS